MANLPRAFVPIPGGLPVPISEPPSNLESAQSVLLYGKPGDGKTTSLGTMIDEGVETFFVITEPRGLDAILDLIRANPSRLPLIHWKHARVTAQGWGGIRAMGSTIAKNSYNAIADMKFGIGKDQVQQFEGFIDSFNNFRCERTDEEYGDVATWDSSRCLVLDSLTGLNKLCYEQTVGYKPNPHQGEWGMMMSLEESIIFKLCSDVRCFFVLIAHMDRGQEEATGKATINPQALGRKLGPTLPALFSEVVVARREGDKFLWSTTEGAAIAKNRSLPLSDKLLPTFSPIVQAHRARMNAIGAVAASPNGSSLAAS